jgi:hypothetical protein
VSKHARTHLYGCTWVSLCAPSNSNSRAALQRTATGDCRPSPPGSRFALVASRVHVDQRPHTDG